MVKNKNSKPQRKGRMNAVTMIVVAVLVATVLTAIFFGALVLGGVFFIIAWVLALTFPCLSICVIFIILFIVVLMALWYRNKIPKYTSKNPTKKR